MVAQAVSPAFPTLRHFCHGPVSRLGQRHRFNLFRQSAARMFAIARKLRDAARIFTVLAAIFAAVAGTALTCRMRAFILLIC